MAGGIKIFSSTTPFDEILVWLRDEATALGCLGAVLRRLELITEEAITNILRHAYPSSEGILEVSLVKRGDSNLVLTICDEGIAFNPLNTVDEEMGLILLRECCDDLHYERVGLRNKLVLTKRIHS